MVANKNIDCSFIVTENSIKSYQSLSKEYSAIEPPTWALLLAQSMRSVGYNVNIVDANAEKLSKEKIYEDIEYGYVSQEAAIKLYGF